MKEMGNTLSYLTETRWSFFFLWRRFDCVPSCSSTTVLLVQRVLAVIIDMDFQLFYSKMAWHEIFCSATLRWREAQGFAVPSQDSNVFVALRYWINNIISLGSTFLCCWLGVLKSFFLSTRRQGENKGSGLTAVATEQSRLTLTRES